MGRCRRIQSGTVVGDGHLDVFLRPFDPQHGGRLVRGVSGNVTEKVCDHLVEPFGIARHHDRTIALVRNRPSGRGLEIADRRIADPCEVDVLRPERTALVETRQEK